MENLLSGYLFPHPPIIIPEIGRGEENNALNTLEGSRLLARSIKEKEPDTIIIISPHGPLFSDAISISLGEVLEGDFMNFGISGLNFSFQNNLELVEDIIHRSKEKEIPLVGIDKAMAENYNVSLKLDHGALVPLYFIGKEYKDFKIIHITYGLLQPELLYEFGNTIKEAVVESGEKVAFIASGDLSHKLSSDGPYEYSPSGIEFDEKLVESLRQGDLKSLVDFDLELSERAGECGLRSLMVLAGFFKGIEVESDIISYEGPFGVGYCNASFLPKESSESEYVKLARRSLEYYMEEGKAMELPKDLSEELLCQRKGAFVTLKKHGKLRACIGTIFPTQDSLGEEIIENAISAGFKDPRFPELREEELRDLEYSVDVLDSPEAISTIDELDVEEYGVIVSKDFRKGLLLPNLDGVDSPEDQVSIALDKAAIGKDEDYKLERFKVSRYF